MSESAANLFFGVLIIFDFDLFVDILGTVRSHAWIGKSSSRGLLHCCYFSAFVLLELLHFPSEGKLFFTRVLSMTHIIPGIRTLSIQIMDTRMSINR